VTDAWNPDQYHRFAAERARPFWDLLALAGPGPFRRAVDLGCGSGELTAAAATSLAVEQMVGIDSSPTMLAAAVAHQTPAVTFEQGDLATWTAAADHDLVLANASLQWVPDHPAVLGRWAAGLTPGGVLAVQVPANGDAPAHRVAAAVAAEEPFASAAPDLPPDPVVANVLAPERYAGLLYELGLRDLRVRLEVYPHELASSAEVVEWVKGTTLTRFWRALPEELHQPFEDRYRALLLAEIGDHQPYLFPFKRILFSGRRPA
jgi:trans-aconitate 2-methyltransferase